MEPVVTENGSVHSRTSGKEKRGGLWLYILGAYFLSWCVGGIVYCMDITTASPSYAVVGAVYMLMPALAAILVQKFVDKQPLKKNLGISFRINKWFFVALITPIILVLLSMGVSLCIPGVGFSASAEGYLSRIALTASGEEVESMRQQIAAFHPVVFFLMSIGQGILAGCTINAFFALGEELGWRGYMLRRLRRFPFMWVSLFTGFVWGLWHFPLILRGHNYPDHPVAGVFMMIVFCMLLSPVMSYIVLKSRSVITAAVFHGTMNAVAGFGTIYLVGGNDLSNGLTGYAGFIAIALVSLGFSLYDKFVTKENIFGTTVDRWLD